VNPPLTQIPVPAGSPPTFIETGWGSGNLATDDHNHIRYGWDIFIDTIIYQGLLRKDRKFRLKYRFFLQKCRAAVSLQQARSERVGRALALHVGGGWTLGLFCDPGSSFLEIWLVSFTYAFVRHENMDCRKSPEPDTRRKVPSTWLLHGVTVKSDTL